MSEFATRRPLLFAWSVNLFFFALSPLLRWFITDGRPAALSVEWAMVLCQGVLAALPLLLIGALGWRRETGFNHPREWREVHLWWVVAIPTVIGLFLLEIPPHPALYYGQMLLLTFLIGVQEEALWRGLLFRALEPLGTIPMVIWSAVLFGTIHFSTIIMGNHPLYSLLQVIASILGGIGVAAIRLRNRSIWPAILVHMLNDFAQFITRPSVFVSTTPPPMLTVLKLVLPLILCLYGLYLLRHKPGVAVAG